MPDRLAEIEQSPIDPTGPCMAAFSGWCPNDRAWLIAEVKQLRIERNALLEENEGLRAGLMEARTS